MPGVGALVLTLWTLWVFFVFSRSRPEAVNRAGLRLGDVKTGQRFILGIVAFLLLQAGLNLIFRLGELQGNGGPIYGLPIPAGLRVPALLVLFIPVAVIGIPLSGLAATFGEEYGWRGFLQDELVKLGTLRGVLLIGVVWGLWHFPVILRGVHTYPETWV
ncbi:MAG: CPBP family intramembrane metalloprotease, partial [Gemmatimonadales bacterium]|nr:CPBP family intramembrane metalloprotease [Gemmatimonadales bacterium]